MRRFLIVLVCVTCGYCGSQSPTGPTPGPPPTTPPPCARRAVRPADLRRRRRHRDVRRNSVATAALLDQLAGSSSRWATTPISRERASSIATATTTRGAGTKAGRSRCRATTNTSRPARLPLLTSTSARWPAARRGRATTASRSATGTSSRSTATSLWGPHPRKPRGCATISLTSRAQLHARLLAPSALHVRT